jgi:exodeoxyribonuclease-3
MRILCWNVNGIRAAEKKGFLDWLEKESPDILCLQETKASPDQLSEALKAPKGYHVYFASSTVKKGYSGVAVYTKQKPKKVTEGLGIKKFDQEGRLLQLDFGKFVLFNAYYPNGGRECKRVPFKMEFYDAFLKQMEKLRKAGKKVVSTGDYNTAHKEIDLARPKENQKSTGFLPEERAWMDKYVGKGYIDTFRHFCDEPEHYTYWDYFTKARERNVGWRIDYFFITPNLLSKLKSAFILSDIYGSDHCPLGIELAV